MSVLKLDLACFLAISAQVNDDEIVATAKFLGDTLAAASTYCEDAVHCLDVLAISIDCALKVGGLAGGRPQLTCSPAQKVYVSVLRTLPPSIT